MLMDMVVVHRRTWRRIGMDLVNGLMVVVVVLRRRHLLGVHHQGEGLHEISGGCDMGCAQGVREWRMLLRLLGLRCTTMTMTMTI